MPGWQWLATPGHSPGHVSLFRNSDRTIIAGDAFITTRQEDAYAVASQKTRNARGRPCISPPTGVRPKSPFKKLAALEPETVICGHGVPMQGEGMRTALHELATRFRDVAIPKNGKYTPAELQRT